MAVGSLDQMFSYVSASWVPSLAFLIEVHGDGHRWLFPPSCFKSWIWNVPICNGENLGVVPSHPDIQKHLHDLHHSSLAGKASSSDWRLLYDGSQCMHGRPQELDIPGIKRANVVVINNLWSIPNNARASIEISLTCSPILLASSLIFINLRFFSAANTKFHDYVTEAMGVVKE